MDDRTLLELAAKAAGYKVRWHEPWGCFVHTAVINITNPPTLAGQRHIWVPLDDGGDALRLAVDLNIAFRNMGHIMTAVGSGGQFNEYADGDAYAATRRAITRAAAEIGRAMP